MTRLILLLVALSLIPAAWAAPSAEGTIDSLHKALLGNMKQGQALGCSGRIQNLRLAIDGSFDIPYLAQKILRKRWPELSDPQRKAFTATLREMVITTYASQFSSYNGESFATVGSELLTPGSQVVRSKFRHGAETVSFDYVLRSNAGDWRIVNVIAQGVSDLAIRSTQYESVFRQKGFDGLINYLQTQTTQNKTGCQPAAGSQ